MRTFKEYLLENNDEAIKARQALDYLIRLVPREELKITPRDLEIELIDVNMDKVPFTFQDIVDYSEREASRISNNPKPLIPYGKMTDVKKAAGKKIYFAKVVYPSFNYDFSDENNFRHDFNSPDFLGWLIFRISKDGIEQFRGGNYGNYSPYYEYRKGDEIEGVDRINPFI